MGYGIVGMGRDHSYNQRKSDRGSDCACSYDRYAGGGGVGHLFVVFGFDLVFWVGGGLEWRRLLESLDVVDDGL
jgi:hypothetical protein